MNTLALIQQAEDLVAQIRRDVGIVASSSINLVFIAMIVAVGLGYKRLRAVHESRARRRNKPLLLAFALGSCVVAVFFAAYFVIDMRIAVASNELSFAADADPRTAYETGVPLTALAGGVFAAVCAIAAARMAWTTPE